MDPKVVGGEGILKLSAWPLSEA